jgi:hypothetical protein
MLKKHSCPCCSQPLLRHISFKRSFWFCSHCHQEMPDLANWQDAQVSQQHWLSKNIPVRQPRKEELQHSATLSSLGLSQKFSELLEESHFAARCP